MKNITDHKSITKNIIAKIVSIAVLINGFLLIISTLVQQLILHSGDRSTQFTIDTSILVGLSLIYFSILLIRRKHTAWVVVLLLYAFYIGVSATQLHLRLHYYSHHPASLRTFLDVYLPIIIIAGLVLSNKAFNVKSDVTSFGSSLRIILIVILVTFLYGVAGFELMDRSDFHKEIGITQALHGTFDEINIFTTSQLKPYTRRARLFEDSLNAVALAAVGYTLLSLFQPLKARFEDQESNRAHTRKLLASGSASSEDFFKIWPHDKSYYFNEYATAGLAFTVHRGVALVVGDPFGAVAEFRKLIVKFEEFCRINDWQPSFIHTEPHFNPLYKNEGYSLQKIGEEAIVSVDHFNSKVIKSKYFRNISSKFDKRGYSIETLKPPHSDAILNRLKDVSDDWLNLPGRAERGFMMGYFSFSYLQQCNLMVLRDDNGVIQAFLNQIQSFDHDEANYDLLRHTKEALGNSGDYILMKFIIYTGTQGFKTVNLGLCPLVGLDKDDVNRGIIDSGLSFLYSNGDRFYSFSGLHKFKQKYEPDWDDRYIAYKRGVRGFTRTLTALNVAMKPHRFHNVRDLNK